MAARPRPEADWELVLKRNPVERLKREKAPLGIRDELPALIAAGLRERRRGGHRPPPVVGPVPRQAEDRHVHAARQAAGRAPDAGEASRDRRGLEPLRQGRRRAVDAAEHPAPLARARAASRRLRRPRLARGSRPPAGAATPCATSPAVRSRDSRTTSSSTARRSSRRRPRSSTAIPTSRTCRASTSTRSRPAPTAATRPRSTASRSSARSTTGREGFAVLVGGGLSSVPRLARDMGVFVAEGGSGRDARRDHRRVGRGPALPRLAREGAAQVHGRRHRPRGDARARRGEARPHARGLHAAADRRPAVEPPRRARAEAGGAALHRRAGAPRPRLRRPDDRDRRPRRARSAATSG